jgi:GNAT superfamily N-acetyltransferase
MQAEADADFEEISAFIPMTGATRVLCAAGAARSLGLSAEISGEIMTHENAAVTAPERDAFLNPALRELYRLLCESRSETFVPPAFEPFYMDLSHRIRHGTAVTAGICENEKLVACAVCAAKTGAEAVVSAVAVHPEYRGRGYGGDMVRAMLLYLEPRKIYIFRAKEENAAFYSSCGFTPSGAFSQCTVNGG